MDMGRLEMCTGDYDDVVVAFVVDSPLDVVGLSATDALVALMNGNNMANPDQRVGACNLPARSGGGLLQRVEREEN